ncbi:MAG: hypothetical protein ACOCUU_01610 [Nanoarchaeota archaeon]
MVVGKFWIKRFLKVIRELKNKGISYEKIAKKIKYPSYLTRAIIPNPTLKFLGVSKEEIKEKDEFISEIIFELYKDISLCKENKNILWDENQIKENFSLDKLIQLDKPPNGYLRTITEFLYFYSDNFGHEFHGPYTLSNGKKLLVREWHNLNAPYYNFSKNFTPNEFKIYELYNKSSIIEIDISNRLNIENEKLEGFYFEVNNRILNKEETESLSEYFINKCKEATKEVLSLNKKELFKKVCLMQFYMLKPLVNILKRNWKPNEDCSKRIDEGIKEEDKILYSIVKSVPLTSEMIRVLFDYRLELPKQ